jgi:hypothetical protein
VIRLSATPQVIPFHTCPVTLWGRRCHGRMAHPKHQPYWFKVGSGCGLLGLGMIALAGALASSTAHLRAAGPYIIVAYVAFALATVCFFSGVRQFRFPLAAKEQDPITSPSAPALADTALDLNWLARCDDNSPDVLLFILENKGDLTATVSFRYLRCKVAVLVTNCSAPKASA